MDTAAQPQRRDNGTQPNATRDSWVRTGNHDVIDLIKTIQDGFKLHVECT